MTTTQLVRPGVFPVPAVEPLTGRLLDVATVVEGDVSWQDTSGLFESFNCLTMSSRAVFPCPATTLSAPVQTASSTATTGGTLAAGTYRAKITAVNSRGETVASTEQSQVTTGSTSTVTWNWNAVSGATGYRVYVTNGAANSEALYVDDNASPYVMTSYPPGGNTAAAPPSSNTAVTPVTKTFEGPAWQDGFRFAVYGGFQCKGVGLDPATASNARASFERRESFGVEQALMQIRFIAGSGWSAPTDLTPAGGAVDPTVGLAILEGDAAVKYGGLPTIHAPREIGTLLTRNGAVQRDGNKLHTVQGSKIASGGGYSSGNQGPAGSAPAAGEKWMYVSGEVVVARSEVFDAAELDRSTNEMSVLVERLYVAAVDCYAAAVRVKVQ